MEEKDYVSLEVSQLLKKKNINIPFKYRRITKELHINNVYKKEELVDFSWGDYTIPAPHLWNTQKCLREQYGLFIDTYRHDGLFNVTILDMYGNYNKNHRLDFEIASCIDDYETYEEAINEGIKRALSLI